MKEDSMDNITMVNLHAGDYVLDWEVWVIREEDAEHGRPKRHLLKEVPAKEGPVDLAERIAKNLHWPFGSVIIGGCRVVGVKEVQ